MTWLICDYGEVISLPQPAGDLAVVESAAGVSDPDPFWTSYWAHRPAYDRADLTAEQYWHLVLGRPTGAVDIERIVAADVASWLHPNPSSLRAAADLRDRGVQLALFSNAPAELARELQGADWLGSFSKKFFSCAIRETKPDAGAYEAVLLELGTGPEYVVFVDDRQANVDGAAAVGIRAFLFEGPDQLAGLV